MSHVPNQDQLLSPRLFDQVVEVRVSKRPRMMFDHNRFIRDWLELFEFIRERGARSKERSPGRNLVHDMDNRSGGFAISV